MMIRFTFLFIVLLNYTNSLGQNVLSNLYNFNHMALNPALAGESGNYGLGIFLGNQFNGTLVPNQVSQIFTIDGKVGVRNMGLGFQGFNNNLGNGRFSGFDLNSSFGFEKDNLSLRVGIRGGLIVLPNAISTRVFDNVEVAAGLGVFTKGDKWWLSVSAPSIVGSSTLQFISNSSKINFMGGYFVGDYETLGLAVSALVDSRQADNNFHVNAKAWVFKKWSPAISIRTKNSKIDRDTESTFKIIPSLSYHINNMSTFGLIFEPNPLNFLLNDFQQLNNQPVLHLYYRYTVAPLNTRPLITLFN